MSLSFQQREDVFLGRGVGQWRGGGTCYLLLPGRRRGRLSTPFLDLLYWGAGECLFVCFGFALFFEVSVAQDNILVPSTSKSFTWG